MGIGIFTLLILCSIGPIVIFHTKHKCDYKEIWYFIMPFVSAIIFGYRVLTGNYEEQDELYLYLIALAISVYSCMVSLIMYSQYHNNKDK